MLSGEGFGQASADEVREALGQLLASSQFSASPRASRFLRFVVEASLAGSADHLKEYLLGVEVFDRKSSFDPRVDTIVRVEAVKLRNRLRAYYRGRGRSAPVIIELPKGRYVPQFRLRGSPKPTPLRTRAPRPMSIAVLPFVNLSSDAGSEYWSDGLTEELISALSRTGKIRVVSRTSAFAFKGKMVNVREIGNQLGADVIVEGSVRNQDNRVRVTAHVTQVSSGDQLWSGTLDREVRDAWAVQEEIAKSVVEGVRLELTPEERGRISSRHTTHPEAFELYLKGRQCAARIDIQSQREALALFEKAHTADPCYPLPQLGIARTQIHLAAFGPPRQFVGRAKAALEEVLALDPEMAEAHALIAVLLSRYEWNWIEAKQHFHVALSLSPYSGEIHGQFAAEYLAPLGQFEEALAENRIAREMDPFSPDVARGCALILILARRFQEAEIECRGLLEKQPNDAFLRMYLGTALRAQERFKESLAEFETLNAAHPSIQYETFAAASRARSGDPGAAEELLGRLKRRSASEFVPAIMFVYLYMALGQIEKCLDALEEAYRNQEFPLMTARALYTFDPVREHPRFVALLRAMHLA